jgi:GT2 family glycosyltransferase
MTVSILTLVRNRNALLANLLGGLAAQTVAAHELIVVRAGGEDPALVLEGAPLATEVVEVDCPDDRIPYSPCRNAAAEAASGDVIVFMDADCIPSATFVERIGAALSEEDALAIGDVIYLPPGATEGAWDEEALRRAGKPHPRRVRPPARGYERSERYEHVWGLCMALRKRTFERLGRFDESYGGYAGEDTDLSFTAREAGVPLVVVAGAAVYHQHHDVFEPPLQQMEATVANAQHFRDKWGRWPMEGWLAQFEQAGLIDWNERAARARILRQPTPEEIEAARFTSAYALRADAEPAA